LNANLGYRFCLVILLFQLGQKVVPYTKFKIYCRRNYKGFYPKLSRPLEKRQTTSVGSRTQVENHCYKRIAVFDQVYLWSSQLSFQDFSLFE